MGSKCTSCLRFYLRERVILQSQITVFKCDVVRFASKHCEGALFTFGCFAVFFCFHGLPPQKSTSSSCCDTSTSWACLTCRTLGCFTSTSHCRFMGSQWQMSVGRGGGEGRGGDGGEERWRRRSQAGVGSGQQSSSQKRRQAGGVEVAGCNASRQPECLTITPAYVTCHLQRLRGSTRRARVQPRWLILCCSAV